MTRVGLVMIVKDEEAVIERALQSARPWISTWLIVDTGSTDGTKEIIRRVLADISGEIVDRPWVNFGHNRTEALALCANRMDWAIMLDADDNLAGPVPPAKLWTCLEIDAMILRIQHGSIWHQRAQIFRVGARWEYEGMVHESPVCRGVKKPTLAALPPETYMVTRCEGSRSRDPEKYLKDAILLEGERVKKPEDTRIQFYLAQSYRDAGRKEEALQGYRRYIELTDKVQTEHTVGFAQERYLAFTNLMLLTPSYREALDAAWRALEMCPHRLEAGFIIMQRWRSEKQPVTQEVYALAAAVTNRTPKPEDIMVQPLIWDWGYDDELAVVAFQTGHPEVARTSSIRCILRGPPEIRDNAIKNTHVAEAAASKNTN